jgi:hypothetical protein
MACLWLAHYSQVLLLFLLRLEIIGVLNIAIWFEALFWLGLMFSSHKE